MKDRVYSSRALQYSYRSWLDLQTSLALRRRQPYQAAHGLLRMWRHLGDDVIGAARTTRLKQIIQENCYRDGVLLSAGENRLRLEYLRSSEAREFRKHYAGIPLAHRVRLRCPNDDDPERQGDLVILKRYDPTTGERGVILLMYSEAILAAAAVFDLAALSTRYMFVLEPSSWGYHDARFLLYLGSDLDVVVQSPRAADFDFIADLQTNLVPSRVGAGEWVDPAVFQPRAQGRPKYDAVMVAAWDPLKRHEVFFRAAARLKENGRRLRFALIGYDMGWTRAPIERLLQHYRLTDDADLFEMIPHDEVARILADSAVSVLLSYREGANRGIYESMFCNTPIIVYRHQCGVNLDHVNSRTGLLVDDSELAESICYVLDHPNEFDPRAWAIENAGYENATTKINEVLKVLAARRNVPWTYGMVPKKSAPNLRYAQPGLYKEFESEYERLSDFLLPAD